MKQLLTILYIYLMYHKVSGNSNFVSNTYTKLNDSMESIQIPLYRSGYNIEKSLGKGGYGNVSLVRVKHTNRFYALKEIPLLLSGEEDMAIIYSLSQNEICSLRQLNNSKYISKLYGSFEHQYEKIQYIYTKGNMITYMTYNKSIFLVLEYIENAKTFHELLIEPSLRQSPKKILKENVTKFYAACLLSALEEMHGKNVARGDIHGHNLLINKNNYLKVIDFGESRFINESNKIHPHDVWLFHKTIKIEPMDHDIVNVMGLICPLVSGKVCQMKQNIMDYTYTHFDHIKKDQKDCEFFFTLEPSLDITVKNFLCRSLCLHPERNITKLKEDPYFNGFHCDDFNRRKMIPPKIE